jgi:hypothetical protein
MNAGRIWDCNARAFAKSISNARMVDDDKLLAVNEIGVLESGMDEVYAKKALADMIGVGAGAAATPQMHAHERLRSIGYMLQTLEEQRRHAMDLNLADVEADLNALTDRLAHLWVAQRNASRFQK